MRTVQATVNITITHSQISQKQTKKSMIKQVEYDQYNNINKSEENKRLRFL